ncbi:MAG: AAA family ATPase [Bacteroidota bacterium]
MPQPSEVILRKLDFEPTEKQLQFFKQLDALLDERSQKKMLLLKGYAGTGKTTLISTLVKLLPLFNFKYMLLAPTGRAAKVISSYSDRSAFTIHKIVFKQVVREDGSVGFERRKNYSKRTVFVVDEASMLSSQSMYGRKSLLDEVISFVFEHDTNRLIIVGDNAQLPPVGQENSNSLDQQFLANRFKQGLQVTGLTEVIRQQAGSGILVNATKLREELQKDKAAISFTIGPYKDIYRMTGERLDDGIRYAYDKYGQDQAMVVCRSNKSAYQYNQYIRQRIFYFENELDAGDVLMIARNNYHHLDSESKAGFLANGDFARINKVRTFEEVHGLRFAELELQLLDYPDEPFEAKIILESLHHDKPSLPDEIVRALYDSVTLDYEDIEDPKEKQKSLRKDPYLNALQVKFAYALTCHKSQGGQWQAVFIDQGYMTEEMINHEFIKWLYTAVTRARQELFLVNFHSHFFNG